MILVLSDVHLGYERCNRNAFNAFLDKYNKDIEHLVILGDLFDMWRRNNAEILLENEDILKKIINLNAENIHYIVGNHDYYMLDLGQRYSNNFPFTILKNLRLTDDQNKFYFIHGYELEVLNLEPISLETYEDFSEKMCSSEDIIGEVTGEIWKIIQRDNIKDTLKKNPRERLISTKTSKRIYEISTSIGKCFILGMKPDERLIFGHTHGPFINKEKTVVNTGSWVNEIKKEFQNSYVEISDGEMELKFFRS